MIGGGFGGFGGMGLGALGGLGGFAPTPEQIQERLKASGIVGYTPPAPVVAPTPPAPVPAPVPVPAPEVAPVAPITTISRPNPTAVAPKPTPPPPTPVRNVMSAVPGQITVPAFDISKLQPPVPVTKPKRSAGLQKRLDEINAEVERKRQEEIAKGPRVVDSPRNKPPNMTKFREALRTGYTGDNVDRVDDFYNTTFVDTMHDPEGDNLYFSDAMDFAEKGAYGIPLTKEEQMLNISSRAYFGQGDLPGYERTRFYEPPPEKYYTDARKAEVGAVTETIGDATSTDGVLNAVSNYYGSDVNRAEETRSFTGDIEGYTSTSPELMAEFQSVIRPLMEEKVAYGMSVGKMDYHEALMDAYNNDPVIRAVYDKYGVKPTRTSARGSEYIYDPLGYRDSRVVKRSPALGNAIKMAASLAFTAGIGGALGSTAAFGGGSSALGTAAAKGLTSAGITAVTGGDGGDILKAGLLGGVGAYGQELTKAAEAAEFAAKGAKAGSELAKAADLAKKTSDTFNTVVKTGKFIDAAIDGNLAPIAVATFGDDFTTAALDKVGLDEKFLSDLNINQSDLAKGLVKTQMELAKGVDFEDALLRGVGEYIMEGGALGPNQTPEFIKAIGDALGEVGSMIDDTFLQPIKEIAEPVIDTARAAGRAVDDAIIQPTREVLKDVDDEVVQPVREVLKDVDDEVVQPVREVLKDVDDEVVQPVREVLKDVDDEIIQPVKEGIEDVYESVELPDVDIDLPDVDIDLPDVNVGLPEAELPKAATPPFVPTLMPRFRQVVERTPEGQEITPYDFGDDALLAFLADNLRKNQEGMAGGGAVRSSYGNLFDSIHSRNPAPASNLDELLRIVGGR